MGILALEYLEKEYSPIGIEDIINSKMVEGAGTQGSILIRYKSTLTLAKPIIDNLLPCTSDSRKVIESMRFTNQFLMLDTEYRDTPKRCRAILRVDRGTRSDYFTNQLT